MVVACGIVTLVIGLDIWFQTLRTRGNLQSHWVQESKETQSLLQQKVVLTVWQPFKTILIFGQFQCCGYLSNNFVVDATCPNAFIAAQTRGCVGPFSNFANSFLDLIFTAMFGIVGMCA